MKRRQTIFEFSGGLAFLALCLLAAAAQAQTVQDAAEVPSGSIALSTTSAANETRVTGPKIYLTDKNKRLWSFDTNSTAVKLIGAGSKVLTDISFAPGGKLYGIDFTKFYRINPSNAQQTLVGSLGVNDVNSLFCYSQSACYAASTKPLHGSAPGKLYRINTATGRASLIGSIAPYYSGGDLAREDGALYLSSNNVTKRLLKINPNTGAPISSVAVGLTDLFGLAAIGSNKLYGFARTTVYRINENTGAKTLVKNLASVAVPGTPYRVSDIYGAAYNGYF